MHRQIVVFLQRQVFADIAICNDQPFFYKGISSSPYIMLQNI